MFNDLISKFEIRDSILILIPHEVVEDELLILISHGSGGPGEAETAMSNFFLSHGYTVGIVDYFTKHNVKKLFWSDRPAYKDAYEATFNEMFDIAIPNYKKVVHIGFSLGGTLGLVNSTKFTKNYCFYPGTVGMTQELLDQDYSNTTVIIAQNDIWCSDYREFASQCKRPPRKWVAKDCYHGFMIPGKEKTIPIVKYVTTENVLSWGQFNTLGPNHEVLKSYFDYTWLTIKLLYNEKECIMYMNKILKECQSL